MAIQKQKGFNFKLFDRVVNHFRKYPGDLAMSQPILVVGKGTRYTEKDGRPSRKVLASLDRESWLSIRDYAMDHLNFPAEVSPDSLFQVSNWPEPFKSRYNETKNRRDQVRAALARFKAFRKEMVEAEKRNAEAEEQPTNFEVNSGCQ